MLTVLEGDCRDRLRELPDESVHCVVTSPPYWGLRDYGTARWEGGKAGCEHTGVRLPGENDKSATNRGSSRDPVSRTCRRCGARRIDSQLGLEATPEAYIAEMVAVFREVRRVLRSDGTCWVNLGDSYAVGKSGRDDSGDNGRFGGPRIEPTQRKAPDGLKPKDLCGIPWAVAFALRADGAASPAHMRDIERMIAAITASYDTRDEWPDRIAAEVERLEAEHIDANRGGWYLRSEIIWAKPNPMPESVTDRPTKAHEQVFLLAKSARYFYDAEAIREGVTGNAHSRGNGINPKCAEPGNGIKQNSSFSGAVNELVSVRNRRTVWTIATAPYSDAHFATFPPKLVEPCVLAGTSARGCCAACGAPWERVVAPTADYAQFKEQERLRKNGGMRNNDLEQLGLTRGSSNKSVSAESVTTGWQPTCTHLDAEVVPCTVLDPFAGSGTVGKVALELGRRAILIELNPKYCEMIERRNQVTLGLPGLA